MRLGPLLLCPLILAACAKAPAAAAPAPAPVQSAPPRAKPETVTVTVRDPEADRKMTRLELRAIEKETQVAELQTRLEDTRDEVVRTMAKLQSVASRAEAASGIAEAEVQLGTLRTRAGAQHPEVLEVSKLVQSASAEFNKSNFGGAFYLASQAKAQATAARTRLGDAKSTPRAGETAFIVPIRLKATSRGNVRESPSTTAAVAFSIEANAQFTAYAYTEDWIRIADDQGRAGWIFRTLVGRP